MNSVSEDIKDILEAESESSLGVDFADNLFINREPAQPDDIITLFDTAGIPAALTLDGKEGSNWRYDSFQMRIRYADPQAAWDMADVLYQYLHGVNYEEVNNTYYGIIRATTSPYLLDYDENNRIRLNINFEVQRRNI